MLGALTSESFAAAPDVAWAKIYGHTGSSLEAYFKVVIETPDKGFLLMGDSVYSSSTYYDSVGMWLLKVDSSGNRIKSKLIRKFSGMNMCKTAGGGYLVSGYDEDLHDCFFSFNENLDSIWKSQTNLYLSRGIKSTLDGNFIGVTYSYIYKLTSNGVVSWSRAYDTSSINGGGGFFDIAVTKNGKYIAAGQNNYNGAWFLMRDNISDSLWSYTYTKPNTRVNVINSIESTSDNGCIAVGYSKVTNTSLYDWLLIRLDSTGRRVWAKTFGNSDLNRNGNYITKTFDGNYVVAGTIDDSIYKGYSYHMWIVKVNAATGDTMWTKQWGGIGRGYYGRGLWIQQTSDSGFIIAGASRTPPTVGSDAVLVKLNKESLTSVENPTNHTSQTETLTISPNPFNPTTKINYTIPTTSNIRLTLYNSNGKFIKTIFSGNRSVGTYTTELDGAGISSGLYIVSLQTEERIIQRKVLLIR